MHHCSSNTKLSVKAHSDSSQSTVEMQWATTAFLKRFKIPTTLLHGPVCPHYFMGLSVLINFT